MGLPAPLIKQGDIIPGIWNLLIAAHTMVIDSLIENVVSLRGYGAGSGKPTLAECFGVPVASPSPAFSDPGYAFAAMLVGGFGTALPAVSNYEIAVLKLLHRGSQNGRRELFRLVRGVFGDKGLLLEARLGADSPRRIEYPAGLLKQRRACLEEGGLDVGKGVHLRQRYYSRPFDKWQQTEGCRPCDLVGNRKPPLLADGSGEP